SFLIGLPLLWGIFLSFAGDGVVHLLYNGKYDDYAYLLPVLSLAPIAAGVTLGLYPLLAALERPDLLARAGIAALVFCVTGGLALMGTFGLIGVAWAIAGSALMTAVFTAYMAARLLRNPPKPTRETVDAPIGEMHP
ncbi:MAG: polysaccharide biosynthesis C-terminal domain-containing protein, partial [Planctomycetota bacterium]